MAFAQQHERVEKNIVNFARLTIFSNNIICLPEKMVKNVQNFPLSHEILFRHSRSSQLLTVAISREKMRQFISDSDANDEVNNTSHKNLPSKFHSHASVKLMEKVLVCLRA
jgi:hypothetical protein